MSISEVYNMDCMEYMKDIPNAFYDLAIIDPPYGIGEDGLKNHSRSNRAKAKHFNMQEKRFREECIGEVRLKNGDVYVQKELFEL